MPAVKVSPQSHCVNPGALVIHAVHSQNILYDLKSLKVITRNLAFQKKVFLARSA
jgi:hypothetical protein